ncbi:VOC family protein [Sporolactobacillus sp. THM7-4]|nr:VOC family protein [Sporolactobacillus sp. THM7-4]
MQCLGIHHSAIICSNYEKSKHFYVDVLGLTVIHETYRANRKSYKLDLMVGRESGGQIELFSFPDPPERPTHPEARGLRHLAFAVADVRAAAKDLTRQGVDVEPIRTDEITGKAFTFFRDPDDLPLELYEV